MRNALAVSALVLCLSVSQVAFAQAPPAPTPLYTGSFGGGIAVTGGNTDTRNFNLAFSLLRDPKTKNVFKSDALYLRGSQNSLLSLDRFSLKLRDEYTFSGRTFLFGESAYLRDQFKDINYLVAPIGGIGFKLVNTDRTSFTLSGGAGGLWESNSYSPVKSSGSVSAGQTYSQKISDDTTFTQSIGTLWKTNDFGDSLTNFAMGLTTSIARKVELKIEFQDSYKSKPPTALIKKNDTAFVTTFLVKY